MEQRRLAMILSASGLEQNPAARRGQCVIRERLGREQFYDCGSAVYPAFPGLCARHGRIVGRMLAAAQPA
jgi:hypothetical protein